EGKDLEIGNAIAGEADAVLLLAHRDQDAAELCQADELRRHDATEQQDHLYEVEDELGVIGADVPAVQGAQVGNAVDAAGIALLADDQDGENGSDRLRDDGEIDAADPALEHCRTDDERE